MERPSSYLLVISPHFEEILKQLKRQKPSLFKNLEKQITKVLQEPARGKPLRNILRSYRRVHIDSFVLIYELYRNEVRLLDFDHHDRIYKKY